MKDKSLSQYSILLVEGFARQVMPMMRHLRKLGCKLITLNSSKLDMGYTSRYPHKKILRRDWDRSNEAKSLEVLLEEIQKNKYDVIIPLTDFSATLMSKNKEKLEQFTRCAVNDWNVFQFASNKQLTMEKCEEAGVPCPKTIKEAHTVEEVIASGIEYPFIIKPRTGYGSIGFHKIDNEEDLAKYFPQVHDQFGNVIVQDYVPQTGIQYKTEILVDKNGVVKSAVVFDKTRWYPIDGGSTCCSRSVERPDIIESCIKLVKAIGWIGYADVDLIEDPRDGSVKVMEINPRITASVKVCFFAGVDFARQIVELYTDQEVTEMLEYKFDKRLRYMHTDILWFIQSPNRFKTKPSWFNFAKTTDQIFSIHDPIPWFSYSIQVVKKAPKELEKRKRK